MTDAILTHSTVDTFSESDDQIAESTPRRSQKSVSRDDRRTRAHRLLTTEIGYIPHKGFHDKHVSAEILRRAAASSSVIQKRSDDEVLKSLPSHLARLCETALLTPDQERELFQRMNYLKYQANALRSRLDPEHATDRELDDIERLINQAKEVRDQIVKANMRLVIAVVKKFVSSHDSFDEMLSDGIVTLIGTVDKFDFDRGFRFSTYAYRAMARSAFHTVMSNRRKRTRFVNNAAKIEKTSDCTPPSSQAELSAPLLQSALLDIIGRLDRREQLIIKSRYSIGTDAKTPTFEILGNQLGVSKERVRQLELRAIAKLREAAAELHLEDLFEPTRE